MKEVKDGHMAGPFDSIPYNSYIQSPIGLVPKHSNKTRMIFHLSYTFGDRPKDQSLNACTPQHLCTVKYNDLDAAVRECLRLSQEALRVCRSGTIYLGKTDLSMAFRVLPMKVRCFCWLVLKAIDPADNKLKYFIDKCLPFGASISCVLYQRFSNALHHIVETRTRKKGITNSLDDFLFIAISKLICNWMMD